MIATNQQISTILKTNPNKSLIQKGKEMNDKLMLHLYGKGMDTAIQQVKHFASDEIYSVQKQYATSNKDLFGRLLQQEDMIFTARGGSQFFGLPDSEESAMNALLDDVRYDMSLRKWVKGFCLPAYRSDPMGIIFMEIEKAGMDDGEFMEPKAYPTYKNIYSIFDYMPNGRELEYVSFRLTAGECLAFGIQDVRLKDMPASTVTDYYRFVDDAKDGIYYFGIEGENGVLLEINIIPHEFGETPGFIISDLIKFDEPQCFCSPVDLTVELADCFLYDRSVRDLQKKYHGFAKAIEPLLTCSTCEGTGLLSGAACPDCTPLGASVGFGYKLKTKVSDVARFPMNMFEKAGFDYKKIFGYISPDIAGWEKQDASLEDLEEMMEMTYWGTVRMKRPKPGKNGDQAITATESDSNNQPKYARLNTTADWAEKTEKMIADFIGKFWFPGFKESSISYGRTYVLETPQQIMDMYQGMRTKGAPDFALDEQLEKYYNAIYQNNPFLQAKFIKLLRVEPFPHLSIIQAKACLADPLDFNCKVYFGEWYSSLPDIVLINTKDAVLREQLRAYVKAKNIPVPIETETVTARATGTN